MKRLLIVGLLLLNIGVVLAASKAVLRVEDSATFKAGVVDHSTVLADEEGTVFVEFPRSILAVETLSHARFEGEILPPKLIEKPAENPKTRMESLVSFEILSGEGEQLTFTDRVLGSRRVSQSFMDKHPDEYVVGALPTLVFVAPDESVGRLKLWRFVSEKEGWIRAGGVQEKTEDGPVVFTAKLEKTGVYTIFDEEPKPKGKVFSVDAEYEQTLAYLEQQKAKIDAQINQLKAAGVTSVAELADLEASQTEGVNESNLFEPDSAFELDPNLFPDGENTEVSVNDSVQNSVKKSDPLIDNKKSENQRFGLGTASQLGELSLASLTKRSPQTKSMREKQLETPEGETINQPVGAQLPEAGMKSNNLWWSWNLFWLVLLFGAIVGGSWWVIKENQ
ncbi:hypothetical protein CSB37_00210 [bacterium DOLZORAL124_38_8]|nr:MAG: hypothetical protein CSB37_00210 [bacterium DOLZORAL124_38_8]